MGLSFSTLGFLAISYRRGSMVVIDMRGPNVIFSQNGDSKRQNRKSGLHVSGSPTQPGPDVVKSLKWTVCPLDKGKQLSLSLAFILTRLQTLSFAYASSHSTSQDTERFIP